MADMLRPKHDEDNRLRFGLSGAKGANDDNAGLSNNVLFSGRGLSLAADSSTARAARRPPVLL